ncbi:GGDEF domain-containing protein [Chiayiivirga flava]|uniref:diguanylate cyclase n=1 Tax=Chiayiivirga flava TaxID=659595 RepID=A0A7W8D7V0_9GAMM|nr:GGDEF domain-containing protein [Chiayiivirga flava]MBB5209485.1 diguanylate cyclase (GGDEF)-like protein [Chiayiivirga flava]
MPAVLPFVFLLLHGLALAAWPARADAASLGFLVLAPAFAAIACAVRGTRGGPRTLWWATAAGFMLWSAGMAATAFGVLRSADDGVAELPMLLFVLYGVPLTFALASPEGDRIRLRLVDAALAATLGVLFYAHTNTFGEGEDARAFSHLRWMFDVENVYIAAFAALRFSAAVRPGERAFFGTLLAFAAVYLPVAAYVNHIEHDLPYGSVTDLLIDVPFLLCAALALRGVATTGAATSRGWQTLVHAGSPLMLPVSLLIVSAFIAQTHTRLAFAGLVVALLGYGARSVLAQLQLSGERDRLDALSRVDSLTGIPNRRSFDDSVAREWARARRAGEGIAVLLVDIDHFKRLNDTHGHQAGDDALRLVAQAIATALRRPGDVAARFGGEEFALLLPGADGSAAGRIAERVRAAIAALGTSGGALTDITASVGAAVVPASALQRIDPATAVSVADQALYSAKDEGRNRVCLRLLGDADGASLHPANV